VIRIDKVWGFEQIICNTPLYCSKFLHVKPGMQCSLHRHTVKEETFFVLSGNCDVVLGSKALSLAEGQSVNVPRGTFHRFASKDGCILIETSTHHNDADVERLMPSGPILVPELTAT